MTYAGGVDRHAAKEALAKVGLAERIHHARWSSPGVNSKGLPLPAPCEESVSLFMR